MECGSLEIAGLSVSASRGAKYVKALSPAARRGNSVRGNIIRSDLTATGGHPILKFNYIVRKYRDISIPKKQFMDGDLPAEKAQITVTNDGGDNPRLVILDPP